jgi:undecaprenyl-diphosphatase
MDFLWWLKEMRTPFFDTFFGLITRLGEEMILIVIFCTIFWCINKRMAYVLGASFFLSGLIVQGAKPVFRVPRPWIYQTAFMPVEGSVGAATGYAFPSGHTQNGTALFGSLGAQIKHKVIKTVLFTLVALIAFSRLYLGVHYISDVLVSLVIGILSIWLALKFITDEPVSKKRELLMAGFVAFLAIIVIGIVAVLYLTEATVASQMRDSVIAAGAALGFAVGMYVERNHIRFSVKAQNLPVQILKIVLGIAGVMAIQEGVRVLGANLFVDGLRYFLMVIWLTLVFPILIKKFFTKREKSGV